MAASTDNATVPLKSSLKKPKHKPIPIVLEDQSICHSRTSRISINSRLPSLPPIVKRSLLCPKLLIFATLYAANSIFVQLAGVFLIAKVTSIEHQFSLDNTFSRFLLISTEIGYVCSVIFTTHFLKRCHIPKILIASASLYGIVSLLLCLVYFGDSRRDRVRITMNRTLLKESYLCNSGNISGINLCVQDDSVADADVWNRWWLLAAFIWLISVAVSPRFPLSTTYIDNNVSDKSYSGIYIGICMIPTVIGPPLSFTLGAALSYIPADVTKPHWLGDWWLVYMVLCVASIILSLPLLYFPKQFDTDGDVQLIETQQESPNWRNCKDLPLSIYRVVKCPVYSLVITGICVENLATWGFLSVSPRYLQHQFQLTYFMANIVQGVQKATSGVIGMLLGGYLIYQYKLHVRGPLRMALLLYPISLAVNALTTLFGCPDPEIHGYENRRFNADDVPGCYCKESTYHPVCAGDDHSYYSPCLAGCTNFTDGLYTHCKSPGPDSVIPGFCGPGCEYLYPYIGAQFLSDVFNCMLVMPLYVVLMRTVPEKDKPMALAILAFFLSLIGIMAAPIVFNYVIDTTCLIWSQLCTGGSSCSMYSLVSQRVRLKLLELGIGIVGLLFLVWAYLVFERQEARIVLELKVTKKLRGTSFNSSKTRPRPRSTVL